MITKVTDMIRFKAKLLWLAGCGVGVWFFFTVIYVNNMSKHNHKEAIRMRTTYHFENLRERVNQRWGENLYKEKKTGSLTYKAAPQSGTDYIDDSDVAKYLMNEKKKRLKKYVNDVNTLVDNKWQGSSRVRKSEEIITNRQKEMLESMPQKDPYVDGLRNRLKNEEAALDRRDINEQIGDKIKQIKEKEKLQNEVLQGDYRNRPMMREPVFLGNQSPSEARVQMENRQVELDVDSIVDVHDKREHRQFARGLIKANLGLDKDTLKKVYRQAIIEGHAALPSNTNVGHQKLTHNLDDPGEPGDDTDLRFQPQHGQQADQQYIQLMNGNKNSRKHPTVYRQVVHVKQTARDQQRMSQRGPEPQNSNTNANEYGRNNRMVQAQNNDKPAQFIQRAYNWENAQQHGGILDQRTRGQYGNVQQKNNFGSFKVAYNTGNQNENGDLVKSGNTFSFQKPDIRQTYSAYNPAQIDQNLESLKFKRIAKQNLNFQIPENNMGQIYYNTNEAASKSHVQNNLARSSKGELQGFQNPTYQSKISQNIKTSNGNAHFEGEHAQQSTGFGLNRGQISMMHNGQRDGQNHIGNLAGLDKNAVSSKVSIVVQNHEKSIMDLKHMDGENALKVQNSHLGDKNYINAGAAGEQSNRPGVVQYNPGNLRKADSPDHGERNNDRNVHSRNKNLQAVHFTNDVDNKKRPIRLDDGADQAIGLNNQQADKTRQLAPARNSGGGSENLPRPLTQDEYLDVKDSYNRHSFNVVASENIPLRRPVPDTRPPGCPTNYDVYNMLKASIVICFHNEAWSTLMRTVHSVLDMTPAQLLQEIILVDDFSTRDYLGGKLEAYVAELPKVFLIRTTQREGLARARMRGVSLAKGEILVFLDSHCECNSHWIEPLVEAIQIDRMKVVSPQMDIIDHTTFAYKPAPSNLYGSFGWDLQFAWRPLPLHERNRRKQPTDGIRTPAMAGGLFAIDKYFFFHLGGFDSGMEIWGSENIELSLRIWMCGGSIEILPCARVGHVFRPTIPYGFPGGPTKILHDNANRVADIWLDEYKGIYYATQPAAYDPTSSSSIQQRLNHRLKLKCKSFTWYMTNVLPELFVPTAAAEYFGLVHNGHTNWCLSYINAQQTTGVLATTCDDYNRYQIFTLSMNKELMFNNQCLTYYPHDNSLQFRTCHSNYGNFQQWTYQANQIQLVFTSQPGTSLCLDLDHKVANQVVIARCLPTSTSQLWRFAYHFNPERMQRLYGNTHT